MLVLINISLFNCCYILCFCWHVRNSSPRSGKSSFTQVVPNDL